MSLYDIARMVTLRHGFDYTDPRTRKTTKAPKVEYIIRSANGVTEGFYKTRAAAQRAANKANEAAPGQGWHVLPAER
jgi:hypothetical protein